MRLRLVSINTAKEDAPYRHRLAMISACLRELVPDLLLLQEAVTIPDEAVDTAAQLAAALGLMMAKAPARRKRRRVDGVIAEGTSGLAILSRHPITASESLPLPTDPRDGERVALLARIATPAGEALIANVHLTYLHDAQALRTRQLEAIFAHPWFGAPPPLTIIGGDFNTDLPQLPALLTGAPSTVHLIDGFVAGGGDPARVTMPAYWGCAYDRALDYLFAVVTPDAPAPRWSEAAIVLAIPDAGGVFPSDHRGVMATVEWPAAPAEGDCRSPHRAATARAAEAGSQPVGAADARPR